MFVDNREENDDIDDHQREDYEQCLAVALSCLVVYRWRCCCERILRLSCNGGLFVWFPNETSPDLKVCWGNQGGGKAQAL